MIKINDRWSVKHDPYCWHLVQTDKRIAETGKNKGKQIEASTTTYHPTLVMCLRHAMDHEARLSDDLSEVLTEWDRVQADFARAFAK